MRLLVLLLLLVPAAAAQPRAVPLGEALALARERALDVLRADAAIAQAQITVDAVADRGRPSLALSVGGGQRYGLSFDQTSGGLTQSRVESLDLGLDVGYTLFDGYERRADRRAAQATLRVAELDRTRARQTAGLAVLQGYLTIAQARATADVAAADVATQRELLEVVSVQAEYGERPAYEVTQQRERVATAQARGLAAERDRALAEARLVARPGAGRRRLHVPHRHRPGRPRGSSTPTRSSRARSTHVLTSPRRRPPHVPSRPSGRRHAPGGGPR